MAACPECFEPVGAGASGMIYAYVYAQNEQGERVSGSEAMLGLFHPACWEQWKQRQPLPEDELPDPSQRIEDIGGAPPSLS
jgi:hypothetical protein